MFRNIGREERNEIDLHGLHVTEAIAKLSRKLAEKKISSSPHIYIITGRGDDVKPISLLLLLFCWTMWQFCLTVQMSKFACNHTEVIIVYI